MKKLLITIIFSLIFIYLLDAQVPTYDLKSPFIKKTIEKYLEVYPSEYPRILMLYFSDPTGCEGNYNLADSISFFSPNTPSIDVSNWLFTINVWQSSYSMSEYAPLFTSEYKGQVLLIYSSMETIFNHSYDEKLITKLERELEKNVGNLDYPTWVVSRLDDDNIIIQASRNILLHAPTGAGL